MKVTSVYCYLFFKNFIYTMNPVISCAIVDVVHHVCDCKFLLYP